MTKNLIIDCDGVLYPLSDITVNDFVSAMKSVYREELHLSGEKQTEISEKTIKEGHLGLFNYIREICYACDYDFHKFCAQMCERIDYEKIAPNKKMLNTLTALAADNRVFIWTNNCREHLAKVYDRLFALTEDELANRGIKSFDISSMEHEGYFYPKQSEEGFGMFLHKISARPEECVLFDDTERNIDIARKNDVEGILISENKTLIKAVKPYIKLNFGAQNIHKIG
ncbi:MAG: hypothetical protein J6039_03480 [Alphaproteobacteria bacterium]|nr:hypothetical protein [Alphaproteobacteria bacterium]